MQACIRPGTFRKRPLWSRDSFSAGRAHRLVIRPCPHLWHLETNTEEGRRPSLVHTLTVGITPHSIVIAYFYFSLFYFNSLEFIHLGFVSHCALMIYLCLWVFCLYICLYTRCISGIHGGHKRALNPQGLALWMVVGHHAGTGNGTWVLCKANKGLSNRCEHGKHGASTFCSFPPPLPCESIRSHLWSQLPESISLFSHWLIPKTKHQGPPIKIHYLVNTG